MLGMIDLNFAPLALALVLFSVAALGIIWSLFEENSKFMAMLGFIGITMSGLFNLQLILAGRDTGVYQTSFGLQYIADAPALGFNFVILIGTALALLISYDYLKRADLEHPEYYPLILLSATGAMIMAAAGDLITLVLGLEIMSLAVYVLSAWRQNARESEEAGMKYFLLWPEAQ